MRKSIFFILMAFLFLVVAIVFTSCKNSKVSEADSNAGQKAIGGPEKILITSPDTTVVVTDSQTEQNSSDGRRYMMISGTDTTQNTKSITIVITGPVKMIDELMEASYGKSKIKYTIIKEESGHKKNNLEDKPQK